MSLRTLRPSVLPLSLGLIVAMPVALAPAAVPRSRVAAPAGTAAGGFAGADALAARRVAEPLPAPFSATPVSSSSAAAPTAGVAAERPTGRVVRATPQRAASRARLAVPRTWEQRRGAAALALISYRWQDLGWQVSFHPARRGLLGVAEFSSRHIYVFVRRSQSVPELAFTIAHEIGHAHDFEFGTSESHQRWRYLRGIDADTPWHGCDGCGDLETPAGDFAEVFALWQVGPVDFRSRMAPLPGKEELRALVEEFRAPYEVSAQ